MIEKITDNILVDFDNPEDKDEHYWQQDKWRYSFDGGKTRKKKPFYNDKSIMITCFVCNA